MATARSGAGPQRLHQGISGGLGTPGKTLHGTTQCWTKAAAPAILQYMFRSWRQSVRELGERVERLEGELGRLNMENADLKSQLKERDARIAKLESVLEEETTKQFLLVYRTFHRLTLIYEPWRVSTKNGRNCLPLWVDQGDGGVVGSTKD